MKAGRVTVKVIVFVVLALIFFFFHSIGNPYFDWYFNSLYSIDSATITQRMLPDGRVEVHEVIEYNMRRPFRGVFREVSPSRAVEIDEINLWTEGVETQSVEFLRLYDNGFEARVWLVPQGSPQQLDPSIHSELTLHVTYVARNVLENGPEVGQVFRQFWGEWDAPASRVSGIFEFPNTVRVQEVYTHPPYEVHQDGNRFEITTPALPPLTFAEARFVTEPVPGMVHAVENPTLTLESIAEVEEPYARRVQGALYPWYIALAVFVILLFLIFWFMGKEHALTYQGVYERELPTEDSPEFVNAMVKNRAGSVDRDGTASALMDLYQKDYIGFEEENKKRAIIVKKNEPGKDISPSQRELLRMLDQFAVEGVFDFKEIESKLSKSVSEARSFNSRVEAYEGAVRADVNQRRFLKTTGNILAKVLAVVMMFTGILVIAMMSDERDLRFLTIPMTVLSGVFWFAGGGLLMVRKDFFGRWTREGREYYLKWLNFRRFLSDYSLISERPPESVILWEKYLVYATALGVADTVMKALQKAIPREIWESQSRHRHFYGPGVFWYGAGFYGLRSTAGSTVARHQSKSSGGGWGSGGGFSGGAGGIGGGSGGGRGGAF